eukprot:GHUV01025210.1.p1 GENE.GHUV01025210.1~~GHUV01025210.1.p1  ORF type:complete len:114 (+),score=13.29 GHUV01025210.1:40-381(+)
MQSAVSPPYSVQQAAVKPKSIMACDSWLASCTVALRGWRGAHLISRMAKPVFWAACCQQCLWQLTSASCYRQYRFRPHQNSASCLWEYTVRVFPYQEICREQLPCNCVVAAAL